MRRIAASLGALCIAAVVTLAGTPAAADNDDPTDLGVTGSVTSLDGLPKQYSPSVRYYLHNYGPNIINASRIMDFWAPGGSTLEPITGSNCTTLSSTHIRCNWFGTNFVDGHDSTPTTGMESFITIHVVDRSKVWTCGRITVTYAHDPNHSNDTGYLRFTQHGQPSSCSAKKPSPKPSPKPAASTVKPVVVQPSTAVASVSPSAVAPSDETSPADAVTSSDPVVDATPPTELAGDGSDLGFGSIMVIIAGFALVLVGGGLLWWRRRRFPATD